MRDIRPRHTHAIRGAHRWLPTVAHELHETLGVFGAVVSIKYLAIHACPAYGPGST